VKARLGGLARRATYISQLTKEGVPFLHLDAGDVFQSKYEISETDRPGVLAVADVFIDAFHRMDVKAVAIGDRDLVLGIETLKAIDKKSKFPLLSSNVLKDGKPVFTPSVLVTVNGKKIGIVGAVTALFVNRQKLEARDGVKLAPASETVPAEIAKLKAQGAEIFILLGHLNDSEVAAAVKAAPEIDFVLGGQWLRMDRVLKRVDGAWVSGGYMRGKNLSVMDLHVKNGSLEFVDRNSKLALEKRKQQLELQIRGREQSMERARKNAPKGNPPANDFLARNLVRLKTELQEVTMDIEDAQAPDQTASYIIWNMLGVDTSFEDEQHVGQAVAAYRAIHPDPTKKKKGVLPGAGNSRGVGPTVAPTVAPRGGKAGAVNPKAQLRRRVAPQNAPPPKSPGRARSATP
jgi:2',3'-cyclic-nucleotide 2'-phosphodiesterase (5'-nucleotidase family)